MTKLLSKFRTIFVWMGFGHQYKYIKVDSYLDTSWEPEGVPSISYVKVCIHCGKIKKGSIYGCNPMTPENFNQHLPYLNIKYD